MIGDMVPPATPDKPSPSKPSPSKPSPGKPSSGNLKTRVLSAVLLAPVILVPIYFGAPYINVLLVISGALMAWEWGRVCNRGHTGLPEALMIVAVAIGLTAGMFYDFPVGGWILIAGAGLVALLSFRVGFEHALWRVTGLVYPGFACLAFFWMRLYPDHGLALIVWLIGVVWATDIAAYFSGRAIGGPKLAPAISPKKTWAGLIGGVVAAGLFGVAMALFLGQDIVIQAALMSGFLAVVAQMGDLFESHLKRRFDVKDSSNIIPGHGGILDRTDGLLSASLVTAVLLWMWGGPT